MPHTQGAFDQTYNVLAANMPAYLLNQNRVATVLLDSVLANRVGCRKIVRAWRPRVSNTTRSSEIDVQNTPEVY